MNFISWIKKHNLFWIIGFSVVMIISFLLQINLNHLDETMLFSWKNIATHTNIFLYFIILAIGIIVAIILSKLKFKFNKKYILLIIFLIAFILPIFLFNIPEINPDVNEFFGIAKYVEIYGPIEFFKQFGTSELTGYRLQGLSIFYGLMFKVFGEARIVVQLINALMFAFSTVLVFLLSRKLWNRKTAIIASFLFMSSPIILIQVPLFLMDMPTLFFTLLVVYLYSAFSTKRTPIFIMVMLITLAAAFAVKTVIVLFLLGSMPILFILILKSEGIHKKRFLLKNLYLFIILCVGAITFFILKKGVSITQMLVDLQQLNIIGNPAHYVNTWSFFFQLGPIIMAFFILSTIFFVLKKQLNYLLLIAWILVPGIFFFNTTLRYMLPVFPAIIIGAAILISHLKKQLCIFTTALIFISSIGVVFVGYAPMMHNEFADVNILLAANYIDDLPEIETAGIYLLPVEILNTTSPKLEIGGYLFDYYSQKSMAFDTPPRINEFYRQMYKSRFEVFNFYKDKCFYDFSCDTMIILSDTTDYFDLIFTPFAEDLHDQLAKDYTLSKRFMQGMQSVERNYVVDIYTKT